MTLTDELLQWVERGTHLYTKSLNDAQALVSGIMEFQDEVFSTQQFRIYTDSVVVYRPALDAYGMIRTIAKTEEGNDNPKSI